MRKPYCPEHLIDLVQISYARIWKCPLNDYQVDDITVVTHNEFYNLTPDKAPFLNRKDDGG